MASQVVELVLQAKDEAGEVLNKIAGNVFSIHRAFEGLVEGGGVVGMAAAALAGVGAAGSAAAIKLTETVVSLEKLQRQTGVGIEQLQVWREVLERGGGEADSLTNALVRLDRALGENGSLVKALHLDTSDTTTAFKQLMEILSRTDAQTGAAISFKLLGQGVKELQGEWERLIAESPEVEEAMRRTGALIGEETAAKTKPLHEALESLKLTWKGLGNTLGEIFLPIANLTMQVLNALLSPVSALVTLLGKVAAQAHEYVGSILKDANDSAAEYLRVTQDLPARHMGEDDRSIGVVRDPRTGAISAVNTAGMYGIEASAKRGHIKTPQEIEDDEKAATAAARKAEARESRLKEIERLLHVGRSAAVEYAAALDSITDSDKRSKMLADLQSGGVDKMSLYDSGALSATEAFGATQRRKTRTGLQPSGVVDDPASYQENLRQVLSLAPRVSKAIMDVKINWQTMLHDSLSASAMLDESLGVMYGSLESGIGDLLVSTTSKLQTFREAWKQLWKGIVDDALRELSRMATSWLLKQLLNFIPGFGPAAGAMATSLNPFDFGGTSGVTGIGRRAAQHVTVNVSAIDSRGVADSFRSPRGEMRNALRQLQLGRAG